MILGQQGPPPAVQCFGLGMHCFPQRMQNSALDDMNSDGFQPSSFEFLGSRDTLGLDQPAARSSELIASYEGEVGQQGCVGWG